MSATENARRDVCPDCEGRGELPVDARQSYWGVWECGWVDCPRCAGTGSLRMTSGRAAVA